MTDPKTFYRELDAVLAKIRIGKRSANFLQYILKDLENNFGPRLNFEHGRLYELRDQTFVLIYANPSVPRGMYKQQLPESETAVQLAFQHRTYIYDDPLQSVFFLQTKIDTYQAQTALWVHTAERSWLIMFKLKEGWQREEITLFINSVRIALNYRLFSDAIGGKLKQAVQIQKSLLPQKPPEIKGYDIFGHSQPAEMVGGDFYDYYQLEESVFGVAIGDASGHGLPAALLIRDVAVGLRMGWAMEFRPVYTLQRLNKVIRRSTYATNFVSLVLCEIEPDGHLFYVNAGHPPPILIQNNTVTLLHATGTTLGFLTDIELGRSHIQMPKASLLVLYSDGFVERSNEEQQMFGMEKFIDLLKKNQHLSAASLVKLVFKTVDRFGKQMPWEDDATIVVIKRL